MADYYLVLQLQDADRRDEVMTFGETAVTLNLMPVFIGPYATSEAALTAKAEFDALASPLVRTAFVVATVTA